MPAHAARKADDGTLPISGFGSHRTRDPELPAGFSTEVRWLAAPKW